MPWLLTLGTLRAISLRYPRLATTSAERQKLRQQTFETTIIERYRRREGSVEEALIEMYLAGVGNCILARAPIRPKSAWKALGVIGPSRSIIK